MYSGFDLYGQKSSTRLFSIRKDLYTNPASLLQTLIFIISVQNHLALLIAIPDKIYYVQLDDYLYVVF